MIALAVALIAGYVGERIPGATSEPLLETRGVGDGDSSALSPLVDIRSRLTNQRNVEMIVVNVERRVVLAIDHAARSSTARSGGRPTTTSVNRTSARLVARPSDVEIRQQVRIVGLGGTRCAGGTGSDRAGPSAAATTRSSSTLSTAEEELSRGDSFVDRLRLAAIRADGPGRRDLARAA